MSYAAELFHSGPADGPDDTGKGYGASAIDRYLVRIGLHELLGRQDEARLSRAVQSGVQARELLAELRRSGDGEPQVTRRLTEAVRAGEDARNEFMQANLRLVVWVAKRFQHRGMDLEDLIQEGNLGLMHAVERFDWRMGFRFSTYATWWIREAISRAVAGNGPGLRLPARAREKSLALWEAGDRLRERLDRAPSVEELASEAGIRPTDAAAILRASARLTSLSRPLGEGDGELGDVIGDTTERPEELVCEATWAEELRTLLADQLTPMEASVIELRFGLGDGRERSLKEVSDRLKISPERARQLESKALARLRHSPSLRLAS